MEHEFADEGEPGLRCPDHGVVAATPEKRFDPSFGSRLAIR